MRHDVVPPRRTAMALAFALGLLSPLAVSPATAGEAQRVKGTSVRIRAPEGFVAADRFAGFQQEATQSSIVVSVLPGPLSETRKGMTREGLATRGMTLLDEAEEAVNGAPAHLLHVEQEVGGVAFEKWLVVAGDTKTTVLVVATTRKPADEALRVALRTALLGARWDASAPTDPFEGLPFLAKAAGKLTQVQRLGNQLLFAEPGAPESGGPRGPIYIVGVSHSPMTFPDLAAFSESRRRKIDL